MWHYVLTAAETYLAAGLGVSLTGSTWDWFKHGKVPSPGDVLLVSVFYPWIFWIVYAMWKRGELK